MMMKRSRKNVDINAFKMTSVRKKPQKSFHSFLSCLVESLRSIIMVTRLKFLPRCIPDSLVMVFGIVYNLSDASGVVFRFVG